MCDDHMRFAPKSIPVPRDDELKGIAAEIEEAEEENAGRTNSVLQEFFAVTVTGSGYQVMNQMRSDECTPIVEKFVLKGDSGIAVGERLGGLHDPGMVGITCRDILVYSPKRREGVPQTAFETSTDRFGGHTSSIVALFLTRTDANECLAQHPSLRKWDERWIGHTRLVLDAIGDSHPIFIVDDEVRAKLNPQVG